MAEIKTVVQAFDYLSSAAFRTAQKFQQEITIDTEPFWTKQIRNFRLGLNAIKKQGDSDSLIKPFVEVVRNIYSENSLSFTEEIIGEEESIPHDDFLQIPETQRHNNHGRRRNKGIFFDFKESGVILPVSEPYMAAIELAKRTQDTTLPYPIEILYGLFCLVYQANKDCIDGAEAKALLKNIQILRECREACDEVIEKPKGVMGMFQNLISSFDASKLSEMVGNMTQNPEIGEHLGNTIASFGEKMKEGHNPLDIIKNITGEYMEKMPKQEGQEGMTADQAFSQVTEMFQNVLNTQQVGTGPSSGSEEIESGVSLSELAAAESGSIPEGSSEAGTEK